MSKLEELIKQFCPDGVEYRTIGGDEPLCDIRTGKINANAAKIDGAYLFFTCDANPYRIDTYAFDTDALLISGNGSKVGHLHDYCGKFNAYQRTYVLDNFDKTIYKRFMYHYLNAYLRPYIEIHSKKGSIPYVTLPMLENFEIPVPPLPVQKEIVGILDKYTELEQELEQELELRKKQYEYYRDKMLALEDYDGEVEEVSLGTVARISRGGNFQKKDFVSDGKPCIHYGQIYTRYGLSTDTSLTSVNEEVWNKSKKAKKGNIVMAVTSENYDDVCKCVVWEGDEDAAISGHTAIIDHDIDAHYLAHYFNTSHFYEQKLKIAHGTKVIEVTPAALNDIIIKIPKDIDEQTRIANLLDGFEKLVADISEGLPAEIRMRHQQYEYYRDKLLSFKRKEM